MVTGNMGTSIERLNKNNEIIVGHWRDSEVQRTIKVDWMFVA
jgi:L-arabinose isomerase